MRFFFSLLMAFGLALLSSAHAELVAPDLAQMAERYRAALSDRAPSVPGAADERLASAKAASLAGRPGEAIAALEMLAAQSTVPPRLWLELAAAWRASSPYADQALAAAHIAYREATNESERIEALLLMTSTLRDRLKNAQKQFSAAQNRIAEIDMIRRWRKPDSENEVRVLPKWANPQARLEAVRDSLVASASMNDAAGLLTDIYDEIGRRLDLTDVRAIVDDELAQAEFTIYAQAGDVEDDLGVADENSASPALPKIDVETDADFSRACVYFTLPLNPDSGRYRRYVELREVRGEDNAVVVDVSGLSIDGTTLCVLGIVPGQLYRLSLLRGLPSMSGVELGRRAIAAFRDDDGNDAIEIEFEVPDRPRLVGFRGQAFLLPEASTGEIPLYTVNVPSVPLHLVRITDRTLHRHIALGHIGGRMPKKEFEELLSRFSDSLWEGKAEIPTVRNQTVTTQIPVLDILKERRVSGIVDEAVEAGEVLEDPMPPRKAGDADLSGTFYADPVSDNELPEPTVESGVYALVTMAVQQDLRQKEEVDEEDLAYDCGENCKYLTQWFLRTNIGLSVFQSSDRLHVAARALDSGKAKAEIEIELVTDNNRVLATAHTDKFGVAAFPARLARGQDGNRLAAILAHDRNDFSFILYGKDKLDLSRSGLDGRKRPDFLDGYLYTDRGIYRPGETIDATILVRDASGRVPDKMPPVTVRLLYGERTIAQRTVAAQSWRLGGARLDMEVPRTALLGTYDIAAEIGEGADAITIATGLVQIGQFRPDRARLQFVEPESWDVRVGEDARLVLSGRAYAQYLYGIPPAPNKLAAAVEPNNKPRTGSAGGLRGEIEIRVEAAQSPVPQCYDSLNFGPTDRPVPPNLDRKVVGYSTKQGLLDLDVSGNVAVPATDHPLKAELRVVVYDNAGPLAAKSGTFPIAADRHWFGVSKHPRIRPAPSGDDRDVGAFGFSFDVVAFDAKNRPIARELVWTISKERDVFVWEQSAGAWDYRRDTLSDPIAGYTDRSLVMTGGTAPGADGCLVPNQTIDVDLPLGRYVLSVLDAESGRTTSVRFVAGSQTTDLERPEPNAATVTSDKARYAPGEKIRLNVTAPFDGEILVAFADDDIRVFEASTTDNLTANIEVEARPEWAGRGIYALATVYRRSSDGSLAKGPTRAIGATYFEVVGATRIGQLTITAPRRIQPETSFNVDLCIAKADGTCLENITETGYAIVYAVDEGLISLTGHPPAEPQNHFFGKTELPIEIMDNYARLILRDEGGDRPTRLMLSNYTSDVVVSKAYGPIPIVGGKASIEISDLELNDGTVRLVAMAWLPDLVASAEHSATVRGNVVGQIALPRFLAPGDQPEIPLLLDNVNSSHKGDFAVKIDVPSGMRLTRVIASGRRALPITSGGFVTDLPKGDPRRFDLAFDVEDTFRGEAAEIGIRVAPAEGALSDGVSAWTRSLPIRPVMPPAHDIVSIDLAPRGEVIDIGARLSNVLRQRFEPEGLTFQAQFSSAGPLSVAALVEETFRDRTPTLESLVWRGMILLQSAGSNNAKDEELASIVQQVQSLAADLDGSFVSYRTVDTHTPEERTLLRVGASRSGPEEDYGVLRLALVLDFLTEAHEAGIPVSRRLLDRSVKILNREMEDRISYNCRFPTFYAAHVLVNHDRISRRDIEFAYYCLDPSRTNRLAIAALGALAAAFGDTERLTDLVDAYAEADLPEAESDPLESAMLLYFLRASEFGTTERGAAMIAAAEKAALPRDRPLAISLAHGAWLSRAAPDSDVTFARQSTRLEIGPESLLDQEWQAERGTVLTRQISLADLENIGFRIRNQSDRIVTATILAKGRPVKNRSDVGRLGYVVKRRFFAENGKEFDIGKAPLKTGDVFTVVVEANGRRPKQDTEEIEGKPLIRQQNRALAVVDLLPASFEIETADAYDGFSPRSLLPKPAGKLRFAERRDDRLAAIVLPASAQPGGDELDAIDAAEADFRIAYRVRVTTPGKFVMPPVLVEPVVDPMITYRTELSEIEVGRAALVER